MKNCLNSRGNILKNIRINRHKFENRNVYNYEKGKEIRIVTLSFELFLFKKKKKEEKLNFQTQIKGNTKVAVRGNRCPEHRKMWSMCQVRESRYWRQNVIEDRPLAIVPWTGCC